MADRKRARSPIREPLSCPMILGPLGIAVPVPPKARTAVRPASLPEPPRPPPKLPLRCSSSAAPARTTMPKPPPTMLAKPLPAAPGPTISLPTWLRDRSKAFATPELPPELPAYSTPKLPLVRHMLSGLQSKPKLPIKGPPPTKRKHEHAGGHCTA